MKDGEFENNDDINLDRGIPPALDSDRWELSPNSTGEKLEIASREFWLPFLAVELEKLRQNGDLEVVIPLGRKANEAISHLYNYKANNITNDALYKKNMGGEITVIPSIHTSNMGRNIGDVDKYKIEDDEEYCSYLAQEINSVL